MNDLSIQIAQQALDLSSSLVTTLVVAAIGFMVCWFLIIGYSMKFSLWAAGVGRFGFWKSVGVVTSTSIVSTLVSCGIMFAFPGNVMAALGGAVASVLAYAFMIARIGRCGIGRGIATYFYNWLFNAIAMVPMILVMLGAAYALGNSSPTMRADWEKLRTHLASSAAAMPGATDGEGRRTAGFDITQVAGRWSEATQAGSMFGSNEDAVSDTAVEMAEQFPGLTMSEDSSIFDSFFTEETSSPASSGCSKSKCGRSKAKITPKKPVPPDTSGLQSNPFAK